MPSSVIIGSGGSGSGGSGSNASVGVNGAVAPTSSTEIGFINGSGNEVGVSATNPLPITGTITASNPSVGLTGSTAPTSATEIGVIDISGKLQGASASNPVRTDPTGTTLQPVSGTITANQGTSPWVVAGGGTAGTAATGVVTVQGIAAMTPLLVTSTFSSPQHVIVDSGTITAVTAITNALPAGTNVIGHVITDSGSTTAVTQATAANLNATVVGTGTFAVQATGTLTNNNAAPSTNNIGALTFLANAAAPSFTEGDLVLASCDLSGHHRVVATGQVAAGSAAAGNPVLVGGSDNAGNARPIPLVGGGNGLAIGNATSTGADGISNANLRQLDATVNPGPIQIASYSFNGATWDRKRTPNKFFTAQVNATATGNSAVWTPTTGKKFRIMKFQVTAQGLAATATAVVTVSFQDGTGAIGTGTYDVDVPAVANVVSGTDNISGAWIDLGNGFLSAAANNVLNFNISAAGTGTVGTYRINVAGTEE